MWPTSWSRTVSVMLLAALVPQATPAQARHAIGLHVGRNDALPLETTLGGLSYTSWAGILGVRGSGALSLGRVDRSATSDDGTIKITAWTADADVLLSPFRLFGAGAAGGLRPFGLLGIGGHGARYPEGDRASIATWSYGGGAAWHLTRGFALEATARRRSLLQEDVLLPPGFTNEWEYRAGVAIEFGGRRDADRARSSRTRRGAERPRRRMPERDDARRDDRRDEPPVLAKPGRTPRSGTSAARILETANRYEGIRYTYGGASPTKGFDCSGYVQYVFARNGIDLPRTARQMASIGEDVPLDRYAFEAGDLLFFADNGTRIDHVAIYLGDGRIIHSTASGGGVRIDDLDSPRGEWFDRRLVAARRIVDSGRPMIHRLDEEQRPDSLDPPDKAPPPGA